MRGPDAAEADENHTMAHDEKHDEHGHGEAEGEHKKHKKHHPHRHEEHEHEEGWIVSFADNVLLMMGFFVIMLAMNMGPKGTASASKETEDRMADFAIAVREAFNSPVDMGSNAAGDQSLIRRMRERTTKGEVTTPGPDGRDQQAQTVRQTNIRGADGFVEFDQHATTLTESSNRTIRQMAERIVGKRWMVEIRGHSSKWESQRDQRVARELSYERAYSVAAELVKLGVKWDQIRLVASGDGAPVAARASSKDDARTNQRVEILILKEAMPDDAYSN